MKKLVLVVGTTADYIHYLDKINNSYSLVFLTDKNERKNAKESAPKKNVEVLCDISNFENSLECLNRCLRKCNISLSGIVCFDCESMELSSFISATLGLNFESLDAIRMCRSKFLSKEAWLKNKLTTPRVTQTNDIDRAKEFFLSLENNNNPYCVIKPTSGAGSELVSLCKNLKELEHTFLFTQKEMEKRIGNRLYSSELLDNTKLIIEEYIEGTEYSCDFFINEEEIKIIRVCEKIKLKQKVFGIISGYKITNSIPKITHTKFIRTLKKAARSLNIRKSICMIDFIVSNGEIYLIEIAPRPGGDCLPQLIRKSSKQDILSLNVKSSYSNTVKFKDYRKIKELIAIRLFAQTAGTLDSINYSKLKKNKDVLEFNITARSNNIELPPKDYDSWILGNIILNKKNISVNEIAEILNSIEVKII